MPPRTSPSSHHRFLPFYAFILFSAIFILKLDVIISEKIFAARRDQHTVIPRSIKEETIPETVPNGTFDRLFLVTWGERNAHITNNGELLTLSLDRESGSGFQSRKELLFGRINMEVKLVPGNAAGTVATYYFSSQGDHHDEIDFEFLGNSSGNPYTLHTNVFSQGKGEREQQFFLWFDPTLDFHTYSILWNPKSIIWFVDGQPIRQFRNAERRLRVPFPSEQPMRVYSSIWNADDWGTQGGRVKRDWRLAPFTAAYRNFSLEGCIWSPMTRRSLCKAADMEGMESMRFELDRRSRGRMKRLQKDYMVYDYCKDRWRFPKGPAPECKIN